MLQKIKKGQGLTEFALILPILLLVLLGIIEAAWIIWAYISVQNVARETARYAVTGQPLNTEGDPWTLTPTYVDPSDDTIKKPSVSEEDYRMYHIIEFAKERAGYTGLPIDDFPGQNWNDTEFYNNMDRPRAFGVLVQGQTAPDDVGGTAFHPGLRGLNIQVRTYYNVALLDPIYNTVMGGRPIHLEGEVRLQNEGLNLALAGEVPEFAPVGGDTTGQGGAQTTTPFMTIYLENVPTTDIPAGSDINIYLDQHEASRTYYVCMDGVPIGTSNPENPVSTSSSGIKLLAGHTVSLGTSPGTHTFSSHLLDPTCGANTLAASTVINVTSATDPAITVGNTGHADYPWPDNSRVRVAVFAHDPDTTYNILFNSVTMPVGDGTSDPCQVTTDDTKSGATICAIPDGLSIDSYLITSGFATNTVQVTNATLQVQGSSTVPDNSAIRVNIRRHAPQHQYFLYLGPTGIEVPFTTNNEGEAVIDYYVPNNTDGVLQLRTHDDNGFGAPASATREIAVTTLTVQQTTDPFINIIGNTQRSAGDVVELYLRNHSPSTLYDVWLATNTSSSASIGSYITTDTDTEGDSIKLSYQIPSDAASGNAMFISYFTGQSSVFSATAPIEILDTARIVIAGGDTHFPEETITISLLDHSPDTAYDIFIDLNGDGAITANEKVQDSIVTDGNGEASFTYTLPTAADLGNLNVTRDVISRIQDNNINIATTDLILVEADLTVDDIVFPPDPQPGADMPVQLHILNTAGITLSDFIFDNDLYFNPAIAPTYTHVLPPGDQKIWIDSIGPNQTIVITPVINVYNEGTYTVYGRTDTSNKVKEAFENNNIHSEPLIISCDLPTDEDEFSNGTISPWQQTFFGDGDGGASPGWISWYRQPGKPSELLAMRSVQPASVKMVQPPVLPVVRSASLPAADNLPEESNPVVGTYNVEPAAAKSKAAAIPHQQTNITVRLSANSDDAEEQLNDGRIRRWANPLRIGTRTLGLRYQNVPVPFGATITNAFVRFTAANNDASTTDHTYYGELNANPAAFTNAYVDPYNITDRADTAASATRTSVPAWSTGTEYTSPDLSAIIQEIINLPGWNSGQTMVLVVEGTGRRRAWAHNGNNALSPELVIEYSTGPVDTPTPTNTPTPTPTNTPTFTPTPTPTPTTVGGCSPPAGYALPVTWGTSADIGTASEGYTAQSGGNNIYVCGSGTTIWGTGPDSFRYVYQQGLNDDIEFRARMTTWNPSSNGWSKGGLMLRATNAGNAAFLHIVFTGANGIVMQARPNTGGNTITTAYSGYNNQPPPDDVWLGIRKINNTVSAYYSTTGIGSVDTWTQIGGDVTMALGSNFLAGFGVSAYNNNQHAEATFEEAAITQLIPATATATPTPTLTPIPTETPTGTPLPPGSSCGLNYIFQEQSSQVIMEAEGYSSKQDALGGTWEQQYDSEKTVMIIPNGSTSDNNTGLGINGPVLLYQINFQTGGDYHVYIRGRSPNNSNQDDSVHVGLDGVPVTTDSGLGLTGFGDTMSWQNQSNNGQDTVISVPPGGGLFTFYMWMREDGTIIDKIWLTTDQNPDTTTDPAESPCTPPGPTPTPTGTPTNTPTPTPTSTAVPPADFNPPINLTATLAPNSIDVINITWTDTSGNEGNDPEEDGFILERSINGGDWEQIASLERDTTFYPDNNVSCGPNSYSYRVRGYIAPDIFSETSNEDGADTGSCPADSCTGSQELDGQLVLCSAGSGVTAGTDSSAGYLFFHQEDPVDSYAFDMVIRLMSVPTQTSQSLAGLEVRETLSAGANKVQVVLRNQNKEVRAYSRGSANPSDSWQATGGIPDASGHVPTWLRIVRANGKFYFYYNAIDEETPVYGAWQLLGSTTDVMGSSVYVGLVNATSSSTTLGQSVWDNYKISCPLDLFNASITCGAVTETSGVAVINAVNYIDKFPSNTSPVRQWQPRTRSNLPAMFFDGTNFTQANYPDAPLLEYAVNIEQSDTYYVWLYGYSPNNDGNTIQIGFNGERLEFGTMESGNTGLRWFNTETVGRPVSKYLEQGVHTINFWGAEDDFELLQILLTNQPGFTPDDEFNSQSACMSPVPPEFPPKLEQCTAVLQNTGFETSDGSGYALNWETGGRGTETIYGPTAYEDSFGLALRSILFGTIINNPFTYQRFTIPGWLNEDSTANLKLYKAVEQLGPRTPEDQLLFTLLDDSGQNVIIPQELANGAQEPDVGGTLPLAEDFREVQLDLFGTSAISSSGIVNLAGDTVQAYIYMPNVSSDPDYPASTDFYIDNVELEICTSQPVPDAQADRGKVEGQVYIQTSQGLKAVAGASVWAFRLDPPGPVQVTYSIDGNSGGTPVGYYSFNNLEPGDTYTLYAEFVDSSGAPFGISDSVQIVAGQTTPHNLYLTLGDIGGGSTLY